jgi:type I restriction enzyme, S subunit
MNMTPLSDPSAFRTISGLWKGKKGPLIEGHVIRSTNFRKDGLLDYSDIAVLEVEERAAATRELEAQDIIIERSGGGPKQPVGRVGLFAPSDPTKHYFTSNFTTALRVVDRERFDPLFVSLFMQALYSSGATETLQRATNGIRNLDWTEYLNFAVPEMDIAAQRFVASGIAQVRQAYRFEDELIALTEELKRTTMRELFTRGRRGEAQKDSQKAGRSNLFWTCAPSFPVGRRAKALQNIGQAICRGCPERI